MKPQPKDFDTYSQALVLATKPSLSEAQLYEVAELYNDAVGIKDAQLKEDVLFIIKNRLWRMPIEGV